LIILNRLLSDQTIFLITKFATSPKLTIPTNILLPMHCNIKVGCIPIVNMLPSVLIAMLMQLAMINPLTPNHFIPKEQAVQYTRLL